MATLAAEMAVVRLLDAWARFCRALVVNSAAGRARTAVGRRLRRVPHVRSIRDADQLLVSSCVCTRRGPNWAVANHCVQAARFLAIENRLEVTSALGAVNSPSERLRAFRNYLAHRNRDTATEVRVKENMAQHLPVDLTTLTDTLTASGVTLFEEWATGLCDVAEAAIQ